LPGLTHGLRVRLAELGVRTLRELVGARELELARLLPLGFTRVKHLQFQAARALEGLPAAEPEPVFESAPRGVAPETARKPASAFETFAPPPSEPFETAGPFA
jgi:predicted RecB family nuclease